MELVFFDRNEQVTEALEREFDTYSNAMVFTGNLEEIPECDAIVAAGNSFGIMDGGLDAAMANQLPGLKERVRHYLDQDYYGEIPVGNAVIVEAGDDPDHAPFQWVVYTPTMRYPRPIATEVVYDCMRAALLAVERFNDLRMGAIATLAVPGLGTSTGGVGAFKAAKMMRLAYESIYENDLRPENWDQVSNRLKAIYGTHE